MKTDIVILAAGKGTRMKSALPKVMHTLAGRPLVKHVVDTASRLQVSETPDIHVVIGHGAERVEAYFAGTGVNLVYQLEQLGTGHAVAQALPVMSKDGVTLVLYGDVPLTATNSLEALLAKVTPTSMGLLTAVPDSSTGYGRIVRDSHGKVTAIVEEKDATDEQRQIKEINTGILAIESRHLHDWLPKLSNSNAQGEYYLTDVIAMAVSAGLTVETVNPNQIEETLGVNNRLQLAALERFYQQQQANQLMTLGASLADPSRIDVRGSLTTGQDCSIDVNAVFEGRVVLGDNVSIGPNCVLKNCTIAEGTRIEAFTHIEEATIGAHCTLGPYARVRPGTVMEQGAKLGNFVEVKKAHIGKGSKVNHLTYVGDTEMGEGVNIGAGTITCNYDGANKYVTTIHDNVFVGSNSTLVAPVTLNEGSFVGAGSVITKDIPANKLALGRSKQVVIENWKRPVKDKK